MVTEGMSGTTQVSHTLLLPSWDTQTWASALLSILLLWHQLQAVLTEQQFLEDSYDNEWEVRREREEGEEVHQIRSEFLAVIINSDHSSCYGHKNVATVVVKVQDHAKLLELWFLGCVRVHVCVCVCMDVCHNRWREVLKLQLQMYFLRKIRLIVILWTIVLNIRQSTCIIICIYTCMYCYCIVGDRVYNVGVLLTVILHILE